MWINIILAIIYVSAVGLIFYRIRRLRKKIPLEDRNKMTMLQFYLLLLGVNKYVPRTTDVIGETERVISSFSQSWLELDVKFRQIEEIFKSRKKELENSSSILEDIKKQRAEEESRIKALREANPEIAKAFVDAISQTQKQSERRQLLVQALFFVFGIIVTVTVDLIIRSFGE